jgi:hypothetical protein
MNKLYKDIKIWKHVDAKTAVRYNCLADLTIGRFAVQSADFFQRPVSREQLQVFDRQYLELFIEISPHERCEWFESLEDAIAAHDRDFLNDPG